MRVGHSRERASSLLRLADEKILSYPYKEVPTCWRRLYTDASILSVVALFACSKVDAEPSQNDWFDAIKMLDMAIIVAGSPGPMRSETSFRLIALAQERIKLAPSIASISDSEIRPAKRARLISEADLSPPPVLRPLHHLNEPPDFETFLAMHREPFVISGGCLNWPAMSPLSPWKSITYLRDLAGPGRVVPVEVGGNYTSTGWGQKIIPFARFLDSLTPSVEAKSGTREKLYLAQHDLFRQFPQLANDIAIPDFVYSAPSPPSSAPDYKPPANEEGVIVNSWLGPQGTLSPAHTDPFFNCYGSYQKASCGRARLMPRHVAQVVGSKWVWVAPPEIGAFMYAYGGAPVAPNENECEESTSTASSYMTNTSQVDVSLAVDSKELATFSKYVKNVVPVAQQAILKEGDLLFMPPG